MNYERPFAIHPRRPDDIVLSEAELSTVVEGSPSWFVQRVAQFHIPAVRLDGDHIHIEGIGFLTVSEALRLAHTITDLVTP